MKAFQCDDLDEQAEEVRLRRMFHQNPEVGFTEFWTTARIGEYLEPLNCRLLYGDELKTRLPKQTTLQEEQRQKAYALARKKHGRDAWLGRLSATTGIVAIFKTNKPGPKTAFRFDIDALPIQESADKDHRPCKEKFQSANACMHACGHDGHIALGLGLARKLSCALDQLSGEYYLLFQPAEELIAGGKLFSQLDFVKDLNYLLPVHIGLTNKRKIICGLSFLANKNYRVSFYGRAAHAAANPESGKNALLAACHAVSALYGIPRHGKGATRINVGQFTSENAINVIADKAQFALDLRGESNEIGEDVARQVENILRGASQMHDVRYQTELLAESITAENSPELIAEVKKACLDIGIPLDEIVESELIPVSEDATYIMREVSSNGGHCAYVCLGCPTYGGHHNDKFDFDEDILPMGVNLLYRLAVNLSQNPVP